MFTIQGLGCWLWATPQRNLALLSRFVVLVVMLSFVDFLFCSIAWTCLLWFYNLLKYQLLLKLGNLNIPCPLFAICFDLRIYYRASIDYQLTPTQWQVAYTSLFLWAVGVVPFKDDFWTTSYVLFLFFSFLFFFLILIYLKVPIWMCFCKH